MDNDPYIESNRLLWNDWTGIHEQSDMYDVPGFKAGRFRLHPVEKEELGDISGKSLLHLQCHFGIDSLSLAHAGATVTGVDFSERAITLARSLSAEIGVPATFVQSNIYDLPGVLEGQFDIVFTSYGVLGWLPDIPGWARVVSHFLKPGGTFYIVECHPIVWVYEDDENKQLKMAYSYFQQEVIGLEVKGSYAAPDHPYRGTEYGWNHTMADYISSLVAAGLRIEFLHEFPFLAWQAFSSMTRDDQRYWHLPGDMLPLMFSIKATKPTVP